MIQHHPHALTGGPFSDAHLPTTTYVHRPTDFPGFHLDAIDQAEAEMPTPLAKAYVVLLSEWFDVDHTAEDFTLDRLRKELTKL